MKYHYFYQTRANEERDGWLDAKSRQDAFTRLRRQGIKPYKLIGNDPIAWKRWAAILVLSALCLVLGATLVRTEKAAKAGEVAERSPIYGDASAIQAHVAKNWADVFPEAGEQYLAMYAEPGKAAANIFVASEALERAAKRDTPIAADDPDEVKKMKRIVNGMKAELREYIAAGGTAALYMGRLIERQQIEAKLAKSIRGEFKSLRRQINDDNREAILKKWNEKNELLRDMGFRTELVPDEL